MQTKATEVNRFNENVRRIQLSVIQLTCNHIQYII